MFIDFVKRKYLLISFIFIIFLSFIIFKPQTKADLVYFYPQSCLGSFANPEKAQGEREVDDPDLINEANSAVYYGGFKEIYCGNFQGPIKEGEIKKITLHFNWVLTKELREKPIIEPTQSESFIEKILPSKTIEINIATSDIPIYNLNEINTGSSELYDNDINSSEVNETDTNELNKTNEEEIESATSSQIFRFIKFVFAQEETLSNTNINENINESANDSTNENTNTSINESTDQTLNDTNTSDFNPSSSVEMTTEITETSTETSIETSTTITETSTEISTDLTLEIQENIITTPKSLFDIHYTLDGQNWNYLGSINENNWQGINFEIPVNDWLDISKIQIKINSYPDTDYFLYLESMWLEVEYENPQITYNFQNLTEGVFNVSVPTATEEINNEELSIEEVDERKVDEELSKNIKIESTTSSEQNIIFDEPLKVRKLTKKVNIKNIDDLNCFAEEFTINLNEGDTKLVNLRLSGGGMKNLEIGSLPAGIDIVFTENNDYQISTNMNSTQLKIYRQKGSDKGNFSLPIIFSSENSTIICQINVITN